MLHWALLCLALITGVALLYGLLWYLARMYERVINAIAVVGKETWRIF